MGIIKKLKKTIALRQRYKKERTCSAGFPVGFYNWWSTDPNILANDWFLQFIKYRLNPVSNEKINFISVAGRRKILNLIKKEQKPVVFYTGENVYSKEAFNFTAYEDHLLSEVDLAMGFAYIDHPSYLRFPVWLIDFPVEANELSIKKALQSMQSKRLNTKHLFCSLVARHDLNGIRSKLVHLLGSIGHIDCAGDFLNNTSILRNEYNNDKARFLERYMFNLCPENSNTQGYVTEKIFDAIKAGCLPIYWGSKNNPEPDVLNKDAILFFDEYNMDSLSNKVKELYSNQNLYSEFMHQNIFLPTAAEYVSQILDELEIRLKALIKNI